MQVAPDGPHDDLSRVQADPDLNRASLGPPDFFGVPVHRFLHPERRIARADGMILVGEWRSEGTHNAVTDHLIHPSPGRAVADGSTVNVPDLAAESEDEYPTGRALQRQFGHRTMVSSPLLREGVPVGVIGLFRGEVRPFSDKQIRRLETFADQAVIAIENVRLFKELQARNRDLTEALEQQTATSEILRVISGSPTDVQPVFDNIVCSAVRLCEARFAAVYRYDGDVLDLAGHYNFTPETLAEVRQIFPTRELDGSSVGRAIRERRVVHIADFESDIQAPAFSRRVARTLGYRSMLVVPMLRDEQPAGAVVVGRAEPGAFSQRHIELLKTFADQAVIAIENVRLFTELRDKNQALTEAHRQVTEALEQQTATSEILRVISSSPTDEQPVFDAIVQSARRLCQATFSVVFLTEAGQLTLAAVQGVDAAGITALQGAYPRPVARDTTSGRAVLDRRVVHIEDTWLDPEYTHPLRDTIALRSVLTVPIFREGLAIGAVTVWRAEMSPFTDKQIALLQTFADQAVSRQHVPRAAHAAQRHYRLLGRADRSHVRRAQGAGIVDGTAEISVTDYTGVGIAPEDQEAVFEEFRQVGGAEKKAEGTGLGLALCRKFVELHGGRISVTSEVGAGSTFTFTLPLTRPTQNIK